MVLLDQETSKLDHEQAQADPTKTKHRGSLVQLLEATKNKRPPEVEKILARKPELANYIDRRGRTLLHYAAILLTSDSVANTAERSQLERLSIECVGLITMASDLRLWWQQDQDGLSVLHLAVISGNVALVRHLLFEHQHSIRYPLVCILDQELHSALHWAVITNSLECVRLLTEFAGAKLAHERDLNGATPLHYATQTRDYPKYRRQLRRHLFRSRSPTDDPAAAPEARGSFGANESLDSCSQAPESSSERDLDQAQSVAYNNLDILDYMTQLPGIDLELRDNDRRTPLLWAASSGNRDALEMLLARGAQPEASDSNQLNAFHCAAAHGFTGCLEVLLAHKHFIQRPTLPATIGANRLLNAPDQLSCTPIFYAVLSADVDCLEFLLDRGADPNWQDARGRTAAHFAALRGQLAALKALEARGANLWLPNKQGDLALHYAVRSGRQQVVDWLLARSPYERALNAINSSGRSPIHLAILTNNQPMLEHLIKLGANIDQLMRVRDKTRDRPTSLSGSRAQAPAGLVYESPLDLARRLERRPLVSLLESRNARSAQQLLSSRRHLASSRSLFDLKEAKAATPIGFETASSSSGTASSPAGTPPAEMRAERPYEGGLSYRNQLMDASIKCKVYSAGQMAQDGNEDDSRMASGQVLGAASGRQLGGRASGSQEIVTRVNVFTNGPCSRCSARCRCSGGSSTPTSQLPYLDDTSESDRRVTRRSSPAEEEPRFDRRLEKRRQLDRYRKHVRSPIRDYIRSPVSHQKQLIRPRSLSRGRMTSTQESLLSGPARHAVLGANRGQPGVDELANVESGEKFASQAAEVNQSIRRYRQEVRLFEELQRLKRSQIRSGRANEAVLVKRLAEQYRREQAADRQQGASEAALEATYKGPFSYESYERFLYNQLQRVTQPIDGKFDQRRATLSDDKSSAKLELQEELQVTDKLAAELEDQEAVAELQRATGVLVDRDSGLPSGFDGSELAPEETLTVSQDEEEEARLPVEPPKDPTSSQTVAHSEGGDLESTVRRASVSSSRRSSVEVERDQAQSLSSLSKLGVDREDIQASELDEIERQAQTLSSMILVDVLGNVQALQGASDSGKINDNEHDDDDYDTTGSVKNLDKEPSLLSEICSRSQDELTNSTQGRRRMSIVNIGNKLETIIHDVGIQIQPAAEKEPETDDEEANEDAPRESSIGERPTEDDVKGESQANNPDEMIKESESREELELLGEELASSAPGHKQVMTNSGQKMGPTIGAAKESVRLPASSQVASNMISKHRRASSPLSPIYSDISSSSSSSTCRPSRSGSLAYLTAGKEARRIFNGHDLDQWRASLRESRSPVASRPKSPTYLRKLARSRPPRVAYQVNVDDESIKRRWNQVRGEQRRRLGLGTDGSAKSQPNVNAASIFELSDYAQETPFSLLYEINASRAAGSMAKILSTDSQTNKEVSINRKPPRRLNWCHKKLVRIVDARALRRTMSLPESLIYSNDLLKRYNILKL